MSGMRQVDRVIRPEEKGNQEDKEEVSRNTLGSITQYWLVLLYGYCPRYTHTHAHTLLEHSSLLILSELLELSFKPGKWGREKKSLSFFKLSYS